MNKVLSNFIATGVKQPFEKITWEHLQSSYTEAIYNILQGQIGPNYDPRKVYVLFGCEATVGLSDTAISAGAVFSDGEVFTSPAQIVTNPTGGNVIVAKLGATYADTDSVSGTLFSDGGFRQVHQVRQVLFDSSGASGTGNLNGLGSSSFNDFGNFVYLYPSVEVRTTFDGDTITFERDRFINYSTTIAGTQTGIFDPTNAREGVTITVFGVINSGASLSATGSCFPIFNVGANVAGAARRTVKFKCVGIDTNNVLGLGANKVLFTITDLNNA